MLIYLTRKASCAGEVLRCHVELRDSANRRVTIGRRRESSIYRDAGNLCPMVRRGTARKRVEEGIYLYLAIAGDLKTVHFAIALSRAAGGGRRVRTETRFQSPRSIHGGEVGASRESSESQDSDGPVFCVALVVGASYRAHVCRCTCRCISRGSPSL